jgi:pyridinium-3,5-bisthiocarboxylic acid mononucleotide nickel chelatase
LKTLYFDCFSGISGDMTIGALLDLEIDPSVLEEGLKKLRLTSEYELEIKRVVKKGISSTKFDVIVNDHHHHRHYTDIVQMINSSELNENVKTWALKIFKKIGSAEAKIHNSPLEKIHFHEVGGIDSIIDIVGTCILIDHLNVTSIISSPVPLGNGRIRIAHGVYPVPAPATLEILKGIPIQSTEIKGELTTPTGAGILAALVDEFQSIPSFSVESIGYGAGNKDFESHPNVLRLILGST